MKGRSRTVAEKRFQDRMAQLGCIACRKMGYHTPLVSIHHIDGRTKKGAHYYVLPLCGPHHQDMGNGIPAVHPDKARFEKAYGKQIDLFAECIELLGEVPQEALDILGKKKAVYS